jgi:c-di-GMP-binding flagellar brake protein YcgR
MSGTLVHVQQRRVLRRSVRVDCQVVRERDFKLVGSRSIDLSPMGMLVMLQEPVLTGEPLLVAFRLPRSDHWFDSEAVVSRVLHGRRPGDLCRSFAVEFETLEPGAQEYLGRTLRGTPPPLPMREPRIDYAGSVLKAALS